MTNTTEQNNKRWFTSSTGSGLSLTIKGVLVGVVPLIVGLSKVYGYDLTEDELLNLINASFQAASFALVFCGLFRKLFYRIRR